ncbi:toxin-antitoxin system protein [Neisseria sp.]|uniref:toxin-antitoxin system protein n=1 Tax=Neisseria sp. TaxID=192066 RepID=UPI0035A1D147
MGSGLSEMAERRARKIKRLRATKGGLMNDSKWAKIFDVIIAATGIETARAKMLDEERLYEMRLKIYSETLRGHTDDWTAGPLKLSEIEYMAVTLPNDTDLPALAQAINDCGQFEFDLEPGSLTVYGYR